MSTNTLLTVVMPAILAFVMFGIGLSLKLDDFRRVAKEPKAVGIGLFCQLLILPAIAYALIKLLDIAPPYAVGLMILAASPGGPTANMLSHLAGGAVALNVTLTAVGSVLSLVSVPLVAHWSLQHFLGSGQKIEVDSSKLIQAVIIVMIPMAVGMWIAHVKPRVRELLQKPVNIVSILLIVVLVIGSIAKESDKLVAAWQLIGGTVIAFNLLSVTVGYLIPRIFNMGEREAVAVAFEVGIHNGSMAMAIAANAVIVDTVRAAKFDITDFSIAFPAAAYSVLMYVTGAPLVWLSRKRLGTAPQVSTT